MESTIRTVLQSETWKPERWVLPLFEEKACDDIIVIIIIIIIIIIMVKGKFLPRTGHEGPEGE
jgi:hypothetical protein